MKQLISISLAIIFMLSTMGFQISSHFCGGHHMESQVSLGAAELSCGMEELAALCEKPRPTKKCCSDEHQSLQVEDDYTPADFNWISNLDVLAVHTFAVFDQTVSCNLKEILHFTDTSPPPLIQDRPVLFQSFLI